MSEPIEDCSPCADYAPLDAVAEAIKARHLTHVERDSAGRHYFWCEADDCYATHRHYGTEGEAFEAAAEHERNPG